MFTLDQMLKPIWDTDIVYGESFTMYKDKNGEISAKFLYEPAEIIEVRSATLETLYEEGKDYYLKDGKIFLTENTTIPFMEYDDIFLKEELEGKCFPYPDGYLFFTEGHFFHDRQIAVTYRPKNPVWNGYIPEYKGELLKRTINRLEKDKKLNIVLFGDSISVGANASGFTGAAPYQPMFIELLVENLKKTYGAEVTYKNPSVGGKCSSWGMSVLDEAVIAENPDLVILAFGMNGGHPTDVFDEHIKNMVDRIKEANPDTDIILVASSTPNPILTDNRARFWSFQHLYGESLKKFEKEGIALVDIGAIQKEILKNKRFIDITGNNVNHPNDFFIRVHAQALSTLLIK